MFATIRTQTAVLARGACLALGVAACQGGVDPAASGAAAAGGAGATDPASALSAGAPGQGAAAPNPAVDPSAPDVAPTFIRRLTRAEYNYTVQDLLGTELTPADALPVDYVGNGFDNQGELLSVSPLHFELYETAARSLIDELLQAPAESPLAQRLLPCDVAVQGRACAQSVLEGFAARAFRRPATSEQIARLLAVFDGSLAAGDAPLTSLGLALQAALVSPHFLYRIEVDTGQVRRLDGYELASRLSYMLWSSMPDDALFEAAASGALDAPETLTVELERMLSDPKAERFADNFGGQWLVTRRLDEHEADAETFPDFDDGLRQSMLEESRRYFMAMLTEQRPVSDFLLGDFTFVDSRLAEHYALPQPTEDFERVSLQGTQRRGLLGQGAVLTVTSYSTRTSPVLRGKWVLEQLLCSGPPPPPPNVEPLDEQAASDATSLREALEQHRASPACNGCHQVMDEIGLGMESFDAIGRARDAELIDDVGVLPDGTRFDGVTELSAVIGHDERLLGCVTRKLLTYALGRGVEGGEDQRWVTELSQAAQAQGGSLKNVMLQIATSDLFRNRAPQLVATLSADAPPANETAGEE